MGIPTLQCLKPINACLLIVVCLLVFSSFLEAQPPSHTEMSQERIKFELPVAAHLQTISGKVIRGELRSLSHQSIIYTPSSGNGSLETVGWNNVQMLVIPELGMRYRSSDTVKEFIDELLTHDELAMTRESVGSTEQTTPESFSNEVTVPEMPTADDSETTITTSDLAPLVDDGPKVTITCANCMRDVSGNANSGQTCPHCGILWDENPFAPEESNVFRPIEPRIAVGPINNENFVDQPAIGGPVPVGAPDPAPVLNAANAPVAVPQPTQIQSQPQEITLATLPLWMKGSIFVIALGVLYYFAFYIR